MNWDEENKDKDEQEKQKQEEHLVECASCHMRVVAETVQGGLCSPCRVEQGR